MRFLIYAVLLVGVGCWVGFTGLAEGMLVNDEAAFAYTTDHMLRTGDWVVPHIAGPKPHLNATPLYNWLCALTAPLLGDENLRHRTWSAAFGVGCAVGVLVLGTLLFRAEVGFLAGLLLLGNTSFVFYHGMRSCVMESALTFFVTAMTLFYVATWQDPKRAMLWWSGVGACLGFAVLTKPPAMGGFFFCALVGYHFVTRRELGWRARIAGPVRAAAVAALVAIPWYWAVYSRVGPGALKSLFLGNSVVRAVNTHGAPTRMVSYYAEQIWQSSWGCKVGFAALTWGVSCAILGRDRRVWAFLMVLVAPFLLAISNAATKHQHYAYPLFPFFSVAAAGLLFAGFPPRAPTDGSGDGQTRRSLAIAGVTAAIFIVQHDFRMIRAHMRVPRFDHPVVRLSAAMESDLSTGRGRLILYKFPPPVDLADFTLGFSFHDHYYVPRVRSAVHARSVEELRALLADGTPAVVVLPPFMPADRLMGAPTPSPDRSLWVQSRGNPYPVLTFHDVETRLQLAEVLRVIELPAHLAPKW